MNEVLKNIEFFTYGEEVWVREADGATHALRETDFDFISKLTEFISTFYPKAYEALCLEYKSCAINQPYYRFRIVCRFIRCNFAVLDTIPDIDSESRCTFEHINCPLRGECRHDRVICHPEFDHKLRPSELRVLELVYMGEPETNIALQLCLSGHTVRTHIRNALARLGLHSKAEFNKYASQHNLFS